MSSLLSVHPRRLLKLRHYHQILTLLQFCADLVTISLSFIAAHWLWKLVGPVLAIDMYEELAFNRYELLFGLTLLTLLIGFEVNDLYSSQRSLLNGKEFFLLLRTWFFACLITMSILFLADELYFSRGMFVLTWLTVLTFLLFERYGFFKFNSFLRVMGVINTSVLVYGSGILARQLIEKIHLTPKLGYQVVGVVDDKPRAASVSGVQVLGTFERLQELIRKHQVEKLFIALSPVSSEKVVQILDVCRATGCQFQIIPSVYEMTLEKIEVSEVEGVPLIRFQEPSPTRTQAFLKRLFDIATSGLLLILTLPFFVVTYVVLVLKRRNPVFTSSIKLGYKGAAFGLLHFNLKDGFFKAVGLHRYPQLWSVLRGEMSLVGPKAENRHSFKELNDFQRHKFNVRPGVIGLWEFSKSRAHQDRAHFLGGDKNLDIYYIQNQNIFLDIMIIAKITLVFIAKVFRYPRHKGL